jgi:hypothetical protein
MDALGILRVLTVRVGNELVGYHFVFVYPHLHYFSTLWAESDMFWLDPEHRRGLTGYWLLRHVRDQLKRDGVKKHTFRTKLHIQSFAPIMKRLGYQPVEMVYSITPE